MTGQQGGVDVEDAVRRYLQYFLLQDLTVGHSHYGLGLEGGQFCQRLRIPQRGRLVDGQAQLLGCQLDGGWPGAAAASRRPVWLRVDGCEWETIGSETAQGGHREFGRSHEDDGHSGRDSSMASGRNANVDRAFLRMLYG